MPIKVTWNESINNDIYWIGLNRSNEGWNWVSGDQLNYTNWGLRNPSATVIKDI